MNRATSLLNQEENARLELYSELKKGLQSIEEGKIKTSKEVRDHMEKRRAAYQNDKV